MSRVGKKPIPLPAGVKVQIADELVVEGPKGRLTVPVPKGIRVEKNDGLLEVKRDGEQYAALHGLTRALAANAVTGVSQVKVCTTASCFMVRGMLRTASTISPR